MSWLRLIRWKNLVIIFLTQFLAWRCIILPGDPEILTPVNFILLSVSTMLIAAAGYIINDYFDIKIDLVNKPDKVVLEKVIPRKQAIITYTVLNLIALILAGVVAIQAHHLEWLMFQLCCTLLLWFYSTNFKRQYITGNVVIALLTALTIIVLILYEPRMHPGVLFRKGVAFPSLNERFLIVDNGWVLCFYAYFAFMLTWMREIVKDMEDIKGDEAAGCMTMPIKKGLKYATRFTILLSLLVIIPLAIAVFNLRYDWLGLPLYITLLIIVPLIVWSVFLVRKFTVQHYHNASRGLKIIMIIGICSLFIYHLHLLTNCAE